jgi:LysR family hydrogen peroxide-inducible transcriptional activator
MKQKNKARKYQFESGSLETLKNLVNSYGGYTLLPQLATSNHGKNSNLIRFEKPVPAREIGLVCVRNHYKNDLIQALGKCIQSSIPEQLLHYKEKELDVMPIE